MTVSRGEENRFGVRWSLFCCRQRIVPTIWLRFRSYGSSLDEWPAQSGDKIEDAGEHLPGQRGLGKLEDGVAGVVHEARAGRDQPLAQQIIATN